MPLQLNPQNLQQLVDLPVGMYPQQQEFLANASQNDSNMLQEQGLKNLFEAQANPLRVRGLDLQNQTAEAGLPGIVANSGMLQRKNKIESLLEDQHINELKGKYSSEELARHVKDGEAVGQIALQGAEHVWSNPLGGKEMVKAQMSKMGMWNPAWDSLPPDRLAMELSNFGQGIQATNAKMTQALQTTEMKTSAAERIAQANIEQRDRAAAMRISAAQALAKEKLQPSVQGYEKQSAKWRELELGETDPELKAKFRHAADLYAEEALKLKAAAATVTTDAKPDVNKLGVPSVGASKAQTSNDPLEGRTATGPDGKKIIRKNGQWVPM